MRLTKSSSNGSASSEINLSTASMIDVVFLLLIFFLVTTSFRVPTQSLVTPIVFQSVSPIRTAEDEIEPVMLAISVRGDVLSYELGGIRTNDTQIIRNVLEKMEPKTVPIFVEVGDGIPFQAATTLIAMCRSCGHDSVAWLPNHEL